MDNLLLRILPVREPDRLVQVQEVITVFGMKKGEGDLRSAAFEFLSTRKEIFSDVVAFSTLDRPVVTINAQPQSIREVDEVSANFFSALGIVPVIGRIPSPSAASGNSGRVAVLSYAFWRTRFGASPSMLGTVLNLDGRPVTIVAVAPTRFLGLSTESAPDIWILGPMLTAEFSKVVGRLTPGITIAHAQARSPFHAEPAQKGKRWPMNARRTRIRAAVRRVG
jgi:hypothetical protein